MTDRLHPDDMALLLGAIFHAPASATFPPRPSVVAASMGHGSMFRMAAEQVRPPEPLTALTPSRPQAYSTDLPRVVEDGVLLPHHPSILRRLAGAASFEEQAAMLDALVLFGGQKSATALTPWIAHHAGCPALTGMLCTCGLDDALA